MNKTTWQAHGARRFPWWDWATGMLVAAGLSMTPLLAADIPVTSVNDSGAGSLRQGLTGAASGDRLAFDSSLNGLTLTNGSPLVFSQPVTLLDPNTITLTDSHAFTLATPLTVDWSGTLNLAGILADGSSAGSLTKNGSGTLALSGVNTFTGGTVLRGGMLRLQNDSALGTGLVTVNNQGGNTIFDLANGVHLDNNILLRTGVVVNAGAATTSRLGGVISESGGSFGLNKTGTGTLILGGANTFSGGVYVSNDGTIRAENNSALGTGTVTVSGGLTLDLAAGVHINNNLLLGNNFITNVDSGSASLSGNIDDAMNASSHFTKTGAGALYLSGSHYAFTGGLTVADGTLFLATDVLQRNINILNSGTLVDNTSTDVTYSGIINGTGNFVKSGSSQLLISGNQTFAGPTTLSGGELVVQGSLASDVNITGSTVVLSGTGTVGSITNNGIVRPGFNNNGDGPLNVNGNFTQQAGGTTEIILKGPAGATGVNATGQAMLDGTLRVTANLPVLSGHHYNIVDATGGVSGHFANVILPTATPGAVYSLIYQPNQVFLEVDQTSGLHEIATTTNGFAVGSALDNISPAATGSLLSMINALGTQTQAQQRQSLNQLSGDIFGTTQTIGLQVGDQFSRSVTSRLINNGQFLAGNPNSQSSDGEVRGQSPTSSMTGWIQGIGVSGNLRSDGNSGGTSYNQGGVVYGVDLGADDSGVIGITGGNSFVGFKEGFGSNGQLTSHQVGLYALKHNDLAYVLGSTNYGYNNFDTTRNISGPGIGQTLQGNYVGHQFGSYLESGLKLRAGWAHFQPLVGLQYLYLAQQGFSESGGPAALTVAGSQADSLRTHLGGRIVVDRVTGPYGAVWTPYWHGRWVAELLNDDRIVNASFNGAPIGGTFATHGDRIGQNYGIFGKGLNVQLSNDWSLFANYDVMVGGRIHTHTGSGGLVYNW